MAYHAEGVLYLTPNARFDYLLNRPEGSNVGRAVNDAMADIEKHNAQLAGYTKPIFQAKCTALFEHVYAAYMGDGKSAFSEGTPPAT